MRSAKASLAFCFEFASRVFLTADNEDRSGQATKRTAKMFLVASHFMDVVQGFALDECEEGGDALEISKETGEKAKYARWKAVDIVKAINEGRQPIPGPPIMGRRDSEGEVVDDTSKDVLERDAPAVPDDGVASRRPSTVQSSGVHESRTQQQVTFHASISSSASSMNAMIDRAKTLNESEKYCRYGLSSIQFEDIPAAVENLQQALNLLKRLT